MTTNCTTHPSRGLRGARLFVFEELPSTNTWIKEHLEDLHHGDVVQTRDQSAGRGRRGRTWTAQPGKDLCMSFLLYPEIAPGRWPQIAQVCALAICKVLISRGAAARLKWPNDILVCDKKICGILTETVSHAGGRALIIGAGCNINSDEGFFRSTGQPGTSLRIESGREHDLDSVIDEICARFSAACDLLTAEGFLPFLDDLRNSCAFLGQEIRWSTEKGTRTVRALDLADDGALVIEENGQRETVCWGEISVG